MKICQIMIRYTPDGLFQAQIMKKELSVSVQPQLKLKRLLVNSNFGKVGALEPGNRTTTIKSKLNTKLLSLFISLNFQLLRDCPKRECIANYWKPAMNTCHRMNILSPLRILWQEVIVDDFVALSNQSKIFIYRGHYTKGAFSFFFLTILLSGFFVNKPCQLQLYFASLRIYQNRFSV